MAGREIVIAGQPIPGDDLGPQEAVKGWSEIQNRSRTYVASRENVALALAEWWDRGGAHHMTWGTGACAYIASVLSVTNSRVYQLISYGRAKWHLSTLLTKSKVAALTEGTLRPAVKADVAPEAIAAAVERAEVLADEEAKGKQKTGPVSIRTRHIKAALKEADPPEPKAAKRRAKPYTPPIITGGWEDIEVAIKGCLELCDRVKGSKTVKGLLQRALDACVEEVQGELA